MKKVVTIILFAIIKLSLHAQMTPTYTVSIPMRDSKNLAADVYVPSGCTSCPTILIQTPYNKNRFRNGLPLGYLQNINSSPFVWVVVDWRGFYGSASAAISSPKRGEDGYDVIDWITNQAWSNDSVGTWGPSALGKIQYETAREQHPAHICAVPLVAYPQTTYDSYFYGGVLEKSRLEQLDALGYGLSTIVLANPYYSLYWQIAKNTTFYPSSIKIPTLQIGGWYDHNVDGMMEWYKACRTNADVSVRDKQWLLFGPWVHGGTGEAYVGSATQGELSYPDAEFKSDTMALQFFNYYLLKNNNNWPLTPSITYYQLGENSWNSSSATSIENSSSGELFLRQNNSLASVTGTGNTVFSVDPNTPSPTLGGPTLNALLDQGPYDQSSLNSRSDLTTFSTGALSSDITVSGNIKISLYLECTQPDADISIRLVDVYPDGRDMLVNDGIRRMRFRNGYTQADESFMTSGQVYSVEIQLPFTNYTWKSGHALKIYISGNNATRWDVNLQNGGEMYTTGTANTATIKVYHNASYQSKITLPGSTPVLSSILTSSENNKITTTPNPAKDQITVNLPGGIFPDFYSIMTSTGKIIYSGSWDSETITTNKLQPGLYILTIYDKEKTFRAKFIKE